MTIMKLNTLSRLQWSGLLILYTLFTPTVFAHNVVLIVTPTEGASPLSVRLSAKQTVVSPGEAVYGYKWQVSGPENFVLGSVPGHIITLNKVGQYTVTLTVEETTKCGLGFSPEERISASVSQIITVVSPGSSLPTPSQPISYEHSEHSTPTQCSESETTPTESSENSSDTSSDSGISDLFGKTEGTDSTPPTTTTELDNFELLGEFENVPTSFYGILLNVDKDSSLPNGSSFGSSEVADVEIAFKVAAEHVGKQADLSVAIEYFPPD
jgi:hypothetical protein